MEPDRRRPARSERRVELLADLLHRQRGQVLARHLQRDPRRVGDDPAPVGAGAAARGVGAAQGLQRLDQRVEPGQG
ncbi:hypothetical protein G5V59_03840 [Nocardioides sp. W3-2-3]|nr:hypothetical protein [Nocardioides convexus]